MTRWLQIASGVILFVVGWQLLASGDLLLPRPLDVAVSFHDSPALFANAALSTLWRVSSGLVIGWLVALPLSCATFTWVSLRRFLTGPIEIIRPIPPIALTPFFIIAIGLSSLSQVALVAMGSFMIFYIGWLEALASLPDVISRSGASLGYTGLRRTVRVALPWAWPRQKPILRLAVATGLGLSVAAEYLGAQGGLGYVIRNARTVLDLAQIAAAAILLGVEAIVLDRLVVGLVDLTSRWNWENTDDARRS